MVVDIFFTHLRSISSFHCESGGTIFRSNLHMDQDFSLIGKKCEACVALELMDEDWMMKRFPFSISHLSFMIGRIIQVNVRLTANDESNLESGKSLPSYF
jgi:hypothetical protein